MIKHVVMWKFQNMAEGHEKSENIEKVTKILLALKPAISDVGSLEIGKNFNSSDAAYDLVLISTHANKDALMGYIKHPAHQEAAALLGKVVAERKVVDFEY